jgi:hypothetical protein
MKQALLVLLLLVCAPAAFAQHAALSAELRGDFGTGGGFAVLTVNGTVMNYAAFLFTSARPTQAHIHRNQGDAVVVNLNVNTLDDGMIVIPQALANELAATPEQFSFDVHLPAGVLRGQLELVELESTDLYIPVVGKVLGANNTNFVTDLRIINHGFDTATVTLDFFAASASGQSEPNVSKTITIAVGEQKVLDDVVGTTLQTTGLGALRIVTDQEITATARVLNDLRTSNQGTTGFSVNATLIDGGAGTAGALPMLSQASGADVASGIGFRTNLGYFNPNSTAVSATFTAHRGDGSVLGTQTVNIPAHSMVQQGAFSLFPSVPEGERAQADFYVTWEAEESLFVYGSVVDNKTGDAVLVQ